MDTPPPPPIPGQPPGIPSRPPYSSAGSTAAFLTVLLVLAGIVNVASIVSTTHELNLLKKVQTGRQVSQSEALSSDRRQRALGGVQLASLAFVALTWLFWQHRSHGNLDSFGARELRFTPGWAVGWWFVPFMNLVRPPQAMSELWNASAPDAGTADWKRRGIPRLIAVWWIVWIFGVIIDFPLVGEGQSIQQFINRDRLSINSDRLHVLAVPLAIAVIRTIQRRQEAAATEARDRG